MIRELRTTDIPRLVELSREMHQLGVYADYDFSPDKLASHFRRYLVDSHRTGFVYVRDGRVDGAMLGFLDRHYFGGDIIAVQNGLFIHPDARGGMAAVRMMRAFHKWAEGNDAACIVFETSQGGKDDRWLRFCENLGYEHVGYVFHRKTRRAQEADDVRQRG